MRLDISPTLGVSHLDIELIIILYIRNLSHFHTLSDALRFVYYVCCVDHDTLNIHTKYHPVHTEHGGEVEPPYIVRAKRVTLHRAL